LEWMGPGVRALEWLAWGCVGQEGGEAGREGLRRKRLRSFQGWLVGGCVGGAWRSLGELPRWLGETGQEDCLGLVRMQSGYPGG